MDQVTVGLLKRVCEQYLPGFLFFSPSKFCKTQKSTETKNPTSPSAVY